MAVDLPVPGETPWGDKLNAAITGVDDDLQTSKSQTDSRLDSLESDTGPDLSGYQQTSEKGQPDGYPELDSYGKVPSAQLPATSGGGGVSDHGDLTGLTDNDHPQYQLSSQKGQPSGYASLASDGKVPAGQLPTVTTSASTSRFVPVVIINGESNSGGYADNAQALPAEIGLRPMVQIFDNVGLASYQDLNIGVNNLLGHTGMSQYNGQCHGLELALANSVEAGQWWDDTVYLIKTGQGGSQISQWNVGGAYYTAFLDRVRNGLALLRNQGKIPVIYFWYSLGINDAIAGTNEATWKTEIEKYHDRVRDEIGFVPIFNTQFMASSTGVNFNDSVQAISAANNMTFAIDATGTTTKDANHWDYAGMKLMGNRMVSATLAFGQHEAYMIRRVDMMAGGNVIAPPGDKPDLVRSPASVSFVEGSSGGSFTVKLSAAPTANVNVSVSASGGNVTPSPTLLTFTTSNWSTTQTVTVTSPDDSGQNGTRTSVVTLSSVGVTAPATVSVSVTDAFVNPGPINTVLPTITGATTISSVVTCSQGTWNGSPTGYTYQWRRDALDIAGQTSNTHIIAVADQGHVLSCTVAATNALGTNTATSANLSVPADTGNFVPFVWKEFANTVDDGSGTIRATAGGATGANATTTIDSTQPFSVLIEWSTAPLTAGVVFMLDEAASTNWNWGGGQTFATAAYQNSGCFSAINDSGTLPWVGYTPTFPVKVRGQKSGNDVIWSTSPDGTTWTDRYTHVNCLVGKTTLYPRALFAISSTGQKIKVSYDITTGAAPTAPVNTVVPAISGSTAVGGVLTASTGTWTQAPTAYAYQWKRDGVDIVAATTNQYTVLAGDPSHNISVTVTATNALGSATSTSANTAIPLPAAPVNTVLPAITGSASLGGVLTCSTGTWDGNPVSYAYQWKRDGTNISGQTAATHTVVAADQTHTLSCAVAATNPQGTVTATSAGLGIADTGSYTPFAWKTLTAATEVNQELVSNGNMPGGANSVVTWDAQQPWQIMAEFASSAMATGVVFHIEDTIDYANFTWGATQTYVSGFYFTAAAGKVYWAENGTLNTEIVGFVPTWPLKYRAQKVGNDIVWSTSPDGTTWTTRYTDAGKLVGKTTLQARILFAIAGAGQKVKASHDLITGTNPTAPVNATPPAITGVTTAGSVLTCSTGAWTQSPTGYTYQWKRDGTDIGAATTNQYTVLAGDQGKNISCAVTATNAIGSATATTTNTLIPIPAPPGNVTLPTISGGTTLAAVLTCTTGTWTQNPTGYTYQWKRDTVNIAGEIAATHTIVAADQAHDLTCAVTASNPQGSASATTAITAVPAASTLVPFGWQNLTNTTVDGSNYVVAASGTMPCGANATSPIDVSAPFTIIIDWDSSTVTTALVTLLDDIQDTDFVWSAQSFTTSVYNNGGTVNSSVNSSATTAWGWTCTFPCKIRLTKSGNDVLYHSSLDGGSNWTLRFTHVGVLAGKTNQFVRVLFAGAATGQKVKVSYDSALLGAVPPANAVAPVITGTATAGSTLTCSTGVWSASPTGYTYQWKRGGVDIAGKTAATYVVVVADENTTLTCAVTATNANGSATATAAGFPIPPPGLTTNPVVWTSLSGVTAPGAGKIVGTATGDGALATTPLDLTKYWEVEIEHPTPVGASNAIVTFIDADNTADFSWGAGQVFLVGEYQYNGAHNVAKDGGTPYPTGKTLTAPFRVKMAKSGATDVAFYYGAGTSGAFEGAPFYTLTNCFSGQTVGYIKCLFAAGGGNVTVRYTQGP